VTDLAHCFVGGWGATENLWRGVLAELPSVARGDNRETVAPPRFFNWAECIGNWPGVPAKLAGLSQRCVLIGWSLGGILTLRAAVESGDEVKSKIAAIVLVSATARFCADAATNYPGVEPRVLAAMRARMKRTADAVLEDFAAECAAPDGDEAVCASWLSQASSFSPAELTAGLDALASLDVREQLNEIAVPCWILHGECDRIVPLRSAEYLAEHIAGAELRVLAGRGHALPFTAAAEIAQCITSVVGMNAG